MKITLICLGSLVVLVAVVWIAGSMLPKGHVATRTIRLRQPPEAVWSAIADFPAMTAWRAGLASTERLPDRNGKQVWREVSKDGSTIPFETTAAEPPKRLVRTIADPSMPFGGSWTYEIQPDGEGARLTITENGEVYNAVFRLFSKFMDQQKTITDFETALARKFGEDPRWEN